MPARQIRPAVAADLPALAALYADLIPDDPPCPPDHAARVLGQLSQWPGCAVLLAEQGDAALGTCTVLVLPNLTRGGRPYALIENVVTRADQRGRGIGKALLDHACARAFAHDCYKVMLMTGSTDPATLGFYHAAGFQQTKTGFQRRAIPPRA